LIKTFRGRETEKIYNREHSRRFNNIGNVVLRRLITLDAAATLADLAGPGLSLEALHGDRKGQHSIRVNDQYRICFVWKSNNAYNVEIVDYH